MFRLINVIKLKIFTYIPAIKLNLVVFPGVDTRFEINVSYVGQ